MIDDWAWHDQEIVTNQVNVLQSEEERKEMYEKKRVLANKCV